MLTELRVKNLALINAAELELGPGLTVLSGETGAGKTALLSSLKLLIGERGDATMVGSYGDEARVEALFMFDSLPGADEMDAASAQASLAGEQATDAKQQEHLVARRINAEGRSRCYLDDSLVTVGRLGDVLGSQVDLYGQHEHQSLLRTSEQLKLLDEYAGEHLLAARESYQKNLQAYGEAADELQRLKELSTRSSSEREQASFVLREIAKLAPQKGEYEALEAELPRLQNGEHLAEAAQTALEHLRGEGGVLERLDVAVKELQALKGIDKTLDQAAQQLYDLSIGVDEVTADISRYAAGIAFDPQALQQTLDRLGELDGLSRRFGPGMSEVFALAERSEALLQSTEDRERLLQDAESSLDEAKKATEKAADTLAQLRAAAAQDFLQALNSSISSLALAGASLEFSVEDLSFDKWTQAGSQSFELLYKPAPASPARPLAKIASGGELSRVMLAVKGLPKNKSASMTLVFDEIDAGIGGKTATAVAERLAHLARQHQVIVITHLAQIAARADKHYLVSKTTNNSTTQTTIVALAGKDRETEIARMLSGSLDTEALAHAKKLLKEAQK